MRHACDTLFIKWDHPKYNTFDDYACYNLHMSRNCYRFDAKWVNVRAQLKDNAETREDNLWTCSADPAEIIVELDQNEAIFNANCVTGKHTRIKVGFAGSPNFTIRATVGQLEIECNVPFRIKRVEDIQYG